MHEPPEDGEDPHEAGDPQLEQHGFTLPEEEGFIEARAPAEGYEPPGAARLRATVTAAHSREQVEALGRELEGLAGRRRGTA